MLQRSTVEHAHAQNDHGIDRRVNASRPGPRLTDSRAAVVVRTTTGPEHFPPFFNWNSVVVQGEAHGN